MGREAVRQWKRDVLRAGAGGVAQDAALHLLVRSIRFGHGRLAVLRLITAVQAGATPSDEHWTYCRQAAESGGRELRALFEATLNAYASRTGAVH